MLCVETRSRSGDCFVRKERFLAMTGYDYGKSCSFLGDWRNCIDPDRRGSVPRREIWNSLWEIAGRYSNRGQERIVLFPDCKLNCDFNSAHYYFECDYQISQ